MKRPPIVALILVAAAIATMIGLGLWQLKRAAWKETLLAELVAASAAPPLAIGSGPIPPDAAFRRASLRFSCSTPAEPRAGRSLAGQSGWVWRAACRTAGGDPINVVLGWSGSTERTEAAVPTDREASGVLVPTDQPPAGTSFYLAEASAPLQPASPPRVDDIPNNHRAYAVQWFAFALTALIVSFLALRRRRA